MHRRTAIFALAALFVGMGTTALLGYLRDPLNEAEKAMVGTWYGYIEREPGNRYSWLAQYRKNRTCSIEFHHYDWSEKVVDIGKWRIDGDRLHTHTRNEAEKFYYLEQLWALLTLQPTHPTGMTFEYTIEVLDSEQCQLLYDSKIRFYSVRVDETFQLPATYPGADSSPNE